MNKMKKAIFGTIFIALVAIAPAMAQQPTNPVEMNNYLTGIVSELYSGGVKWGNKYLEVSTSKDYSEIASTRTELEKLIDAKQAELRTITDVNDSKEFRMAIMSFLKFEKRIVHEGFAPFENLGKNPKQEDVAKAEKTLTELSAAESTEIDKIKTTQAAYAKNNNFTIESDTKE
jgi:hypothetical protein